MKGISADNPLSNHRESRLEMINLGEFAARMGVCVNTVRYWIRTEKLVEGVHYFRAGHIYRFPWGAEFVEKLMLANAPKPLPHRPKMLSRQGNRTRLKYRA